MNVYAEHNTVCNLQQVSHSIFQVILTTLSTGIIFNRSAFAHVHIHSDAFANTERTATDVRICVA